MAFDLDSLRWHHLTEAEARNLGAPPEPEEYSPRKIALKLDDSIATYEFPLPSFNAYRRWRFNPCPDASLESKIGDTLSLHGYVWFAIDFYAGEGFTGIGGLGIFDLRRRTFGVLRDPSLSATSANHLVAKGDTIFMATALEGEGEMFEGSGLVIVDTRNGRVANADRHNSPLIGSTFNAIKLVGENLWMLTDEAVVGWDFKRDTWCAVRMDSVVTNSVAPFSRRLYTLRHPNDWGSVIQDSLVAVSFREKGTPLSLAWRDGGVAEFETNSIFSGWVSKEDLDERRIYDRDDIAGALGLRVYADSQLTLPFHYVKFGTVTQGRTVGKAVRVGLSSLWCDVKYVAPIFSAIAQGQKFVPAWRQHGLTFEALKAEAFAEFRREQYEIDAKIPVIDTSFTIHKGMNLKEISSNVLEMRWLPGNDVDEAAPAGVVFNVGACSNELSIRLLCKGGKLTLNGSEYNLGSSWTTESPKLKASLSFTDAKFADAKGDKLQSVTIKYTFTLLPQAPERPQ